MQSGHDVCLERFARGCEEAVPSCDGGENYKIAKFLIEKGADVNGKYDGQGWIQDFPLGAPTLVGGGANPQHRHFLGKTYVKTKEFGPVGGGGHAGNFCM